MDFFELINEEVFNPDKFEINEIKKENFEINKIMDNNKNVVKQNNDDIVFVSRQMTENQKNEIFCEIEKNEEKNIE